MKSVIAALNAAIDGGEPGPFSLPDARIALHAIETQQLAVTALRQLVADPKNAAALDHAQRFLKLHDDYVKKHTPPVPYDGVANKAQYEAEAAHAAQAEPDASDLV